MAISRRVVKERQSESTPVDEKEIDALIEKGGSPTRANKQQPSDEEDIKAVLLKLPQSQADEIDEELKLLPRHFKRTRTAYILRAIEEKLQRDKSKRK